MMNYDICIFVQQAGKDATEKKKRLAIQNRQLMHITLCKMGKPSLQLNYMK